MSSQQVLINDAEPDFVYTKTMDISELPPNEMLVHTEVPPIFFERAMQGKLKVTVYANVVDGQILSLFDGRKRLLAARKALDVLLAEEYPNEQVIESLQKVTVFCYDNLDVVELGMKDIEFDVNRTVNLQTLLRNIMNIRKILGVEIGDAFIKSSLNIKAQTFKRYTDVLSMKRELLELFFADLMAFGVARSASKLTHEQQEALYNLYREVILPMAAGNGRKPKIQAAHVKQVKAVKTATATQRVYEGIFGNEENPIQVRSVEPNLIVALESIEEIIESGVLLPPQIIKLQEAISMLEERFKDE